MTGKIISLIMALLISIIPTAPPEPTMVYMGDFEVTAYSYDEGGNYSTSSGIEPTPYYTVSTDPSVIPTGTIFYIEGIGEVQAQDTGGAVKGNIIDLHIGHDDCWSFGRQVREVYLYKEGAQDE